MSYVEAFSRFDEETAALKSSVAKNRLTSIFDEGSFVELDRFLKNDDGMCEAVTGYGLVNGTPVYAFSQNKDVSSGAMGRFHAAKIKRVYDLAVQNGAPVVGIFDSLGAHIDEGIEVMESYGELIAASANISGVVPQISLVLGTCIGSAAVLAAQADILIMSESAELYVTSGEILGDKEKTVGTAELAYKNGLASIIADNDSDAVNKARDVLSYLPSNNLSVPLFTEYTAPDKNIFDKNDIDGLFASVFDAGSVIPLCGGYGITAKVAFARLGGTPVGVAATDTSAKDGYLKNCGARKIARFVRMCDAFSIPVITFVDANGLLGDISSELNGSVKDVAMLTHAYAEATTAKIAVVTGNAISSAYVAFVSKAAGNDFVFAWNDSVISSMMPMTAVQFMYKDRLANGETREMLEKEYTLKLASPFNAAANGFIDDVIKAEETTGRLMSAVEAVSSKRVSTISKKHSNISL